MEIELHEKQKEAVAKNPKIVWHEMGEGKSRIALAIYIGLKLKAPNVCVIVCRRKAFNTWKDEIEKCGIDAYMREDDEVSNVRPTFRLVSHAMLDKFLNGFKTTPDFVIYDELYLYSNHKSQRSVAAQELTRAVAGRCIGLSGTIMPARDTLSIWGQARSVGVSHLLASGTTDFYSKYKKSFLADYGRGSVRQWIDLPKAKERILDRLQDVAHIHFPKSKRSILESFQEYPLSLKQFKIIKQLKDEYYYINEKQDFEMELRSGLELIIKVSQLANGWCKNSTGDITRVPSPKLDALCASLEESHANNVQRIVWCHFQYDLEIIQDNLDFEVLKMSGKHKFDSDKWKSGKYSCVLATMGSGSSINDFRNVQHATIFSSTFKHLDYTQSLARTNRYDSGHASCSYSHFRAKGTFDKHIYTILKSTHNIEKEFINRGIIKQWLNS